MKKVSMIIPAYNSEKYIKKCIDSITNQSYKNIEIIIINDGSTDNTKKIISNLAKNNPKIKIYNQKNQGVANTRNTGINCANGEYIMFIDNDDYIDKDYVKTLVKEIEKGYDYVISGFRRVNKEDKILYSQTYKDKPWSFYMFITPWAKIFKKDFIEKNNIKFLPVKIGEDIYFNICAISWSNKKKVINYIGYNWLDNSSSISNTIHKENTTNNKKELIYLFDSIVKNVNKKDFEENEKYYKYFFLKTIIWYVMYSGKNDSSKELFKTYNELKDWLTRNFQKPYKKMFWFNPKGEKITIKILIKTLIFLDKCKMLKIFLKIYSKI